MMILDENEVIPFQKSPWNVLCKKLNFVKDTPFFKTKFKDNFFQSNTTAPFSEIIRLRCLKNPKILQSSRKILNFQENYKI